MPEQQSFTDDCRMTGRTVLLVIRAIDMSVSTFMHHSMGRRYGDRECVLLIPVMLVYSYLLHREPYALAPLWWFTLAVFVRRAMHRMRTSFRWRKMQGVHSEYDGLPYLCSLFPKLPEMTAKGFIEPLLVVFAGILCIAWNPPLGFYLIFAAICMKWLAQTSMAQMDLQVDRVQDSLISQRAVAERLRERTGEFL